MAKTYEEFVSFYKSKGILDMGTSIRRPSKPLNDRQLQRAYKQYLHKLEIQKEKIKAKQSQPRSRDSELSEFIRNRDGNKCRLVWLLSDIEYQEWLSNQGGQGSTIDAAHVFGKNAYPWMRYIPENIVCLNRFSHNSLDTYRSPLNGKIISKEEHENWWKRIVGEETYAKLVELSLRDNR